MNGLGQAGIPIVDYNYGADHTAKAVLVIILQSGTPIFTVLHGNHYL